MYFNIFGLSTRINLLSYAEQAKYVSCFMLLNAEYLLTINLSFLFSGKLHSTEVKGGERNQEDPLESLNQEKGLQR